MKHMDLSPLSDKERERYARHLALTEVGAEGQKRLRESKVAIVGLGGLGSQAALYLGGAGVGSITLIDGDVVQISNLHRQPIYRENDLGAPKAKAAASSLKKLNSDIAITTISENVGAANALKLLSDMDLVVDGTDSFTSRYILSDACEVLRTPLLSASLGSLEGQISLFCCPFPDGSIGPSYRCLYPTPPSASNRCGESGILGPVAGIMGAFLANEALKFLLKIGHGLFGQGLSGKLILFNALTLETQRLDFKRALPPKTMLLKQEEYLEFCGKKRLLPEISEDEFEDRKKRGENLILLDVSEHYESDDIRSAELHIPLRDLSSRISEIPRDSLVAVYCPGEIRSAIAARTLREDFGFTNVYALTWRSA